MIKKINLISLMVLMFDIVIKMIVTSTLKLNSSIIIIRDFFAFTYVRNTGAAFSILEGNRLLLIVVALIVIVMLYKYLSSLKTISSLETIYYGLLIGGIYGNLIDRIIHSYVIDYFDFTIIGYNFPIFNLADICIVVSIFLMMLDIVRGDSNERNKNS